jgi:hypothetical protein
MALNRGRGLCVFMATTKKRRVSRTKCPTCKHPLEPVPYKPVRVPQGGSVRGFEYIGTDLELAPGPDEWAVKPTRKTIKHDDKSITIQVTYHKPMKIADMHDMQLVNTIKYVIRFASRQLMAPFSNFGITKAQILADHPQWASLLGEAKKRKLKIAFGEGYKGAYFTQTWYEEALKEIVFRKLEE